MSKESDEAYTPPWIFDGLDIWFDMDVCAPEGGVPWIPARRSLSLLDDGLTTPWEGNVWMNPPWSKPIPWVEKFISHRNGICLVPASSGRWLGELWREADAAMLPVLGNMAFHKPNLQAWPGGLPIRVIMFGFGMHNTEALAILAQATNGKVRK